MQTHSLDPSDPARPYDVLQPTSPMTPITPMTPFSKEISPKGPSSHQRWKVHFFICLSTLGAYFLQTVLEGANKEKLKVFNVYERTEMVDTELIMGYLSFLPLFTGLVISHSGIRKVFRFFVWAAVLGSLFVVLSFVVKRYFVYLFAETLIRGSIAGLWVAQVYMIIKWFKGKELSLAIGVLGVWKSISTFIAIQLSSHVETIGLLRVLGFAAFFCVLLAVIFWVKIDMVVKNEEEERMIQEEKSLNQPATTALMVALVCFAVGEATRTIYFSLMFPSHSSALITVITKSESFDIFAPIFLLPLFGATADKKNRRITGVFSSFILLAVGSTFFYLFASSESVPIPLLASTLFLVGSCLFEVSFWAILGSFTPEKRLAVILGIAFSLKEIAPRFFSPYLISFEKLIGFTVGLFLALGIKAVMHALKELNDKGEVSKMKQDDTTQMVGATEVV